MYATLRHGSIPTRLKDRLKAALLKLINKRVFSLAVRLMHDARAPSGAVAVPVKIVRGESLWDPRRIFSLLQRGEILHLQI